VVTEEQKGSLFPFSQLRDPLPSFDILDAWVAFLFEVYENSYTSSNLAK